ncbi:MAG TPA: helix-turn-helix domain-containing protein [Rhizobiaceae bacterium]|nr:helix-turn-helix domain-containing protein [Rhizobiaceae bacterium]
MNLQFHTPPDHLAPFVRRFILSDYEVARPIDVRPWSTGNIYLTYFYGPLENYTVSVNGRPHTFAFPAWLAGQVEYHDIHIRIAQRTAAIVAEMTALGFWRLFGKPGRWLTGRTCQLADLGENHHDAATELLLPQAQTGDEALAKVIGFFERAAAGAAATDPMLEQATLRLEQAFGRVSVAELAAEAGVTQRHFTRRFSDVVGLSPKFYGRVLQLNQVIEMLFMPGKNRLADVAQDAGFYDQAHLNRAMMLFFQEGPSAFLKGDHELFRTFLEHLPPPGAKSVSG